MTDRESLHRLAPKLMDELTSFPIGTEFTTSRLAKDICDFDSLMALDEELNSEANKRGYLLDRSAYEECMTGMPFNIGFVLKKK